MKKSTVVGASALAAVVLVGTNTCSAMINPASSKQSTPTVTKTVTATATVTTPGPTVTTPGPTVTVTKNVPGPVKTVTVPGPVTTKTIVKTNPACLTALSLADEGFGYAGEFAEVVTDILTAVQTMDVDALTEANAKLTGVNNKFSTIVGPYTAAKAQCRGN